MYNKHKRRSNHNIISRHQQIKHTKLNWSRNRRKTKVDKNPQIDQLERAYYHQKQLCQAQKQFSIKQFLSKILQYSLIRTIYERSSEIWDTWD